MTYNHGYHGRPIYQCSCGLKLCNLQELRVHIALMTDQWPTHRCTQAHHDRRDRTDTDWLRSRRELALGEALDAEMAKAMGEDNA